jgi:magnesium transporter
VQLIEYGGLAWYDVRSISREIIEFLREEFGFHPLSLEDVTSRVQRPKLDVYDNYLFIVMHFPVHDKLTRKTHPSEVDIFVGQGYVVTIHDGQLKPLVRMFDDALRSEETRARLMSRTSGHLLYYIIDRLVDACFPIVDRVTERIEEIEDMIFLDSGLRTVREISVVRRDLIALRRIIKPQLGVVSQLEHRDLPLVQEEMDVYFGDIADHLAKIWDSLEDQKEVLDGLTATFDSLATHQLNQVIKALTMISVIILPLTLITGIFGMNVPLPYEHSRHALTIIVVMMAASVVVMLAIFRARRWI